MSRQIAWRVPPALDAAAKAQGQTINGAFVHAAVCAALRVNVELPRPGLANADKKTRKRVAKAGVKGRRKDTAH